MDNLVKAASIFLDVVIPTNNGDFPYFMTVLDTSAKHGPGIKAITPYKIGDLCVENIYRRLQ